MPYSDMKDWDYKDKNDKNDDVVEVVGHRINPIRRNDKFTKFDNLFNL